MSATLYTVASAPRRTVFASLGALAAVVSAVTCCLPVVPLALATVSATASAILTPLRPWLLALAVILIGYALFEARRAQRCGRSLTIAGTLLLWTSAAVVAIVLLAPDLLADLLAR